MASASARGEPLLPLSVAEHAVPEATAVRSTLLRSSLDAIEGLGLRERYFQGLPREFHAQVKEVGVGQWLSMELGMAHYGTIDRLGLSEQQAFANGRIVADRVQNSYFGTVIKVLGTSATPWTAFARLPSFWGRLIQGGGCAVYQLGPKDARIEAHGIPLARYPYFRSGWAGMFASSLELITRKVHCRVDGSAQKPLRIDFLISWV